MDTDSFYFAMSGDETVKPGLRQVYEVDKKNWLATDKFATPGLFKPEFVDTRGVWLTATCYFVQDQNKILEKDHSSRS